MPGKSRVHELAREHSVSAKDLLGLLSTMGEFAKSASSTVEPSVAARVHEHYARRAVTPTTRPRIGSNPFGAPARVGDSSASQSMPSHSVAPGVAPAPDAFANPSRATRQVTNSSSAYWAKGFSPTPLELIILQRTMLPGRTESDARNANGRYTADERRRAQAAAAEWANARLCNEPWLSDHDIDRWLSLHPALQPGDIATFHASGVAPRQR